MLLTLLQEEGDIHVVTVVPNKVCHIILHAIHPKTLLSQSSNSHSSRRSIKKRAEVAALQAESKFLVREAEVLTRKLRIKN